MSLIAKLYFPFLSFLGLSVAAQSQLVYSFQKDDSLIRKEYYAQTLRKKKELLESLPREHEKEYKKIYTAHFEELEGLWNSRRTVTSLPEESYLQTLVKKIVQANPELENTDARVVFSRDWWPNAYCMADGSIVINAGLMVYLNNEAELAFIISHELAHYYLQHSKKAISNYVETVNNDEFQRELKRLSKQEYRVNEQLEKLTKSIVFDSRRHSRDKETEADKQAYRFIQKAGFDKSAAITVLQLLDKIDDNTFVKQLNLQEIFSFPQYPFKNKWIRKESSIFSEVGEEDKEGLSKKEKDSLKTHPDCTNRIQLLQRIADNSSGSLFSVNEKQFNQLKKDFIIEITEHCYQSDNLSRNLYYSLAQLKEGNNQPLAIYSVARCLNRIYEQQKNHDLGQMIDVESNTQPVAYNLLLRMLNRIKLDEIASLNYYFCNQHKELMNGYEGFEVEMNKAITFYK